MARLLNAFRFPLRSLALALFVASQSASLPAQSSPMRKAQTLEVLSADYLPETDTIQFKLVNRSQKAVTGYELVIGENEVTQVNWHGGFGEDLLNQVLTEQCRNVGEKSPTANPLDDKSPADKTWEGAIRPGDIYVHSIPANLDERQSNGSARAIHIVVAGVVWSDGSVEADQNFPSAVMSINRSLEREKLDASDSAKVVAILNAHTDDPDIQHRIGDAIKSLQALLADNPQAQPASQGTPARKMLIQSSPVTGNALSNLKNFASLAAPKDAFESYSAFIQCQNEFRSALLKPASSARPSQ